VDWCFLGSRVTSKGILLMWDRRVVKKMEVCVGRFIIVSSFHCVSDNFVWAFAGVYGSNDGHERKLLWDELVGIMSWRTFFFPLFSYFGVLSVHFLYV
jgi:hypothetical protein